MKSCLRQQADLDPSPPSSTRRACHGGTLDPFASGLLLILIGSATRLFNYLHAVPKTYDADISWGMETDTGDLLGKRVEPSLPVEPELAEAAAGLLQPARLDDLLQSFCGLREQVPPNTSALRIDGRRAYEKAHRGEEFALPARKVYLHEARWITHNLPISSRLRLTVAGGYYVRALARDLGRVAGCGAHLSALRRLSIGPWSDPAPGLPHAVPGREVLPWLPTLPLSDDEVGLLRSAGWIAGGGKEIAPQWPLPSGFEQSQRLIRAFHRDRFCFLLRQEGEQLRRIAAFANGL